MTVRTQTFLTSQLYCFSLLSKRLNKIALLQSHLRPEIPEDRCMRPRRTELASEFRTQHRFDDFRLTVKPRTDKSNVCCVPVSGSRDTITGQAKHTAAEMANRVALALAEEGWIPAGPGNAWRGEALLPGSHTPDGQKRGRAGGRPCWSDPC